MQKKIVSGLQFSVVFSALKDEGECKGKARSRFAARCDGPIGLSWSCATTFGILKIRQKGEDMNPHSVITSSPSEKSMLARLRPHAQVREFISRSGPHLLHFRSAPTLIFPSLAIVLGLTTLAASNGQAQGAGKRYEPASVYAGRDLQCKLHAPGSSKSEQLPVFTDDDGYARFFAIRSTSDDKVKSLVLDCNDSTGKPSSFSVDLTSEDTFTPRPVNLENEPGIDRPALNGDPLKYTQAQLLQLGYGLRPDPDMDPDAFARWLEAASVSGRQLEAKRPDLHEHTVTAISGAPWVGSALTGKPHYVSTDATFNVPEAIPGGDSTSTTEIAIWNGLGGFGTGSGLIQGGVNLYTTTSAAQYGSWREYCCGDGDSNGYGGAFVPNPGDKIFSQEWYCDSKGNLNLKGGYGCTFLEDEKSGAILNCTLAGGRPCWSVKALPLCSVSPHTPNCMTVGEAAEFIIEDQSPQVSKTSTAFTDFTPKVTMAGSAYSSATGKYSQTISHDPSIWPLTDFTNTTTHIRVSLGSTDETYFDIEPGVKSYPLYCHGPLSTSHAPVPLTKFKWASVGADTTPPGPGECVWADRGPRGTEIKSGDTNELWGWLDEVANLPSGDYAEFEVYRDPYESNDIVVTKIVGFVSPPF
jgi:hypothetical protein